MTVGDLGTRLGDPSNGLYDAPLEKINWNAAVLLFFV